MTIRPTPSEFLISGNVRVADVLHSIAKAIDNTLSVDPHDPAGNGRRYERLRALESRVRRLAETIEKGK